MIDGIIHTVGQTFSIIVHMALLIAFFLMVAKNIRKKLRFLLKTK